MFINGVEFYNPHVFLPLAVLFFSILQSLVGVGLLLFGTPTLILFGISFGDTLGILLPCSVAINLCQLKGGLPKNRLVLFRIIYISLPMLFFGLLISINGSSSQWVPIFVSITLLCIGALRMSRRATHILNKLVCSYQSVYMVIMGFIHGLSNMGGGLLVVFANTISTDKEEIRKIIAMGYLIFASVQLVTLAVSHSEYLHAEYLYLPMISIITYLFGNVLFKKMNAIQFNNLVTFLVFIYGIITAGKVLM